ncbi:hypothetical protein DFH27DRAFT_175430 [Peziza echinospora]|nr:hypothetical protein DFH27DRAFT_175430 [Peziza echinospora]
MCVFITFISSFAQNLPAWEIFQSKSSYYSMSFHSYSMLSDAVRCLSGLEWGNSLFYCWQSGFISLSNYHSLFFFFFFFFACTTLVSVLLFAFVILIFSAYVLMFPLCSVAVPS